MTLAELRQAIDHCDEQIVRLLNDRTRHVLRIGELKRAAGEEIYVPNRERAVLQRICKLNEGPITDDSLRHIYREVMSSALALEKPMTIAYFGPEATFTHQAAIRRFGSSVAYAPMKTIGDVFTDVAKNRADYGVVPVENSTEGVVNHTLDMFIDSELKIVAQIILPIQHCLLGKATRRDQVKRLYSHPQALAQCRQWVQIHLPTAEIIEASSTTRAAELAARSRNAGAIASSLAAERYRLRILEADIQDNSSNATRFLVLGRRCGSPTGRDRTSFIFSVADEVGSLHRALAPLAKHKINMTRIESRPSKRKAWAYFFFVDVEGHSEDASVADALRELGKHCSFVKILGSYPDAG
ncbi:MAG: prephenate dehydratase [Verrucomicrobiales bacterium]|nr:prephenate dehydratase [Verrucomicrobiales bacterium]